MARILKRFIGKVRNGKLALDEPELFKENLINFEDKYVWLTIDKFFNQRTLPQNRYYFGVIVAILADFFGYTREEMHEALKWEFDRIRENGKPDRVGSTTDLDTAEFEERNERIRQWAMTEYDVYIPLPHEILLEGE